MVLSENETHKSMKQNRQPRKKPRQFIYMWSIFMTKKKRIYHSAGKTRCPHVKETEILFYATHPKN